MTEKQEMSLHPSHLHLFYPSISNRTLMGPYGVDRAVHSMEFTDCENGLGKSFFSFLMTKDSGHTYVPSDTPD